MEAQLDKSYSKWLAIYFKEMSFSVDLRNTVKINQALMMISKIVEFLNELGGRDEPLA